MEVKKEIKAVLAGKGITLTEVVKELNEKHGRNDSVQNLSNKINRGTIRYSEVKEIAEVIGMEIEWSHKEK